jgi:hypothetical protein
MLDISKELQDAYNSRQIKSLHKWQQEFANISSQQYVSVEASTGSGKSLAIKISTHLWLIANSINKVIITVPQRSIGAEFDSETFMLDGKEVHWSAPQNMCADDSESSIKALINFIATPAENLPESLRIMVVCNPTLVMAYTRLNDKSLLNNIKLVIDETHHLSTAQDTLGNFDANGLGKVFLGMIANETNSFLNVTATHFRSDETTIIPNDYKGRFTTLQVPFYRVMEECRKTTKNVKFNYSIYKKGFVNGIKESYVPGEKTIIFIHSKLARTGIANYKEDSVKEVVKGLGKTVKVDKSIGCYVVENGDHRTLVADLVTPDMQDNASKYIRLCANTAKATDNPKEYKVGVIIAMNMFKEGCDYPPLAHCIIHDIRGSYGDIVQMAGRVFRDSDDKPTAKVTLLLPKDLNGPKNDLEFKLQKHLKFILCAMSMIDIFMPVLLRVKQKGGSNRIAFGGNFQSPLSVVGDFVKQTEFKEEVVVEWTRQVKDSDEAKVSWNKRMEVMTAICEKSLADEHKASAASIAEQIMKETAFALASRNTSFDIDEVTEEYLKQIDTTEFLTTFGSDVMSGKMIKDFSGVCLRAMGSNFVTEQECIKWLKDNEVTSTHHPKFKTRPSNIPSNPHRSYGYSSMKEFWELVNPKVVYVTEKECIKWLKDNGVTSHAHPKFKNRPSNIPSKPQRTYGYSSVKEFWEKVNGTCATEKECIKWLKDNRVTSQVDPKFKSRPSNIPSNPHSFYGYSSVKEFWELVNPKVVFVTEKECIKWLKDNGVTSHGHPKFKNHPSNIPSRPHRTYGYSSVKEFWELVNPKVAWATEKECIKWLKDNGVTCSAHPKFKKSRPSNIPSTPHMVYGYSSEKEFWGIVNPKVVFVSEKECIKWCMDNGVTSADCKKFKNRPSNIPSQPYSIYGYSSSKAFWTKVRKGIK